MLIIWLSAASAIGLLFISLAANEGPPDAAGNAVVVAGARDLRQLPPGHCHREDSCGIWAY